jgi:hypothetical protein
MSPQLVDVVVSYTQRGEGVPEAGKTGRVSQRQRTLDRRMLLPCANPACRKGGFLLRREVERARDAGESNTSFEKPCAGYLGAVRTEKGPAAPCPNRLEVEVTLAYRG